MSFLVSLAVLAGIVATIGVVERRPALAFRPLSGPRPYLGTDIAWFAVAGAASAVTAFGFRPQLEKLAVGPAGSLPPVVRFVAAVVLFDLLSFAVHMGLHRSGRLWHVHKVHHSSRHLDGLATTRAHMLENFIRFIPPQAVLFLLGVPVAQVTAAVALYAAYGIFNHSNLNLDLRWMEPVLVTPRMHRRHHVPATSLNNFGTIFSVWDRLLGQCVRLDTTPEEAFGVPGEVDTYPQHFAAAVRQPVLALAARPFGRDFRSMLR